MACTIASSLSCFHNCNNAAAKDYGRFLLQAIGSTSKGSHLCEKIMFPSHSSTTDRVLFRSISSDYRATPIRSKSEFVRDIDCGEEYVNIKSSVRRGSLAVFVSGRGSILMSIHRATLSGYVNGEIAVVVTNKNTCGGAVYARENGIPVILFSGKKDDPLGLTSNDLLSTMRKFEVNIIILAGYLKFLPADIIQSYPRSILNIHPSLLPSFGGKGYFGMNVHKAVIASGARYSGATVHFVDEQYDTGPIVAQRVVPVFSDDGAEDLAERVHHQEHQLYVEVVTAACEERIVWRDDGVPLIRSKGDPGLFV